MKGLRSLSSFPNSRFYIKGTLTATHYVDSVILGGNAQASIKYSEDYSHSFMNLKGELSGTIGLGPVTATAKASLELLDDEYKDKYSTEITVKAQPRLKSIPSNCAELFKAMDSFDEVIKEERHFPMLEKGSQKIDGVPIRFKLVPLAGILAVGKLPTYKLMNEVLLAKFQDAMLFLADYGDREGHFIKSEIREKVPAIVAIFQDYSHPLTVELEVWVQNLAITATNLKSEANSIFKNYKNGLVSEDDIETFVTKVSEEMDKEEILEKIEGYKTWGRKELDGVNAHDIEDLVDETIPEKAPTETLKKREDEDDEEDSDEEDDFPPPIPSIAFFTNAKELSDWLAVDKIPKLFMQTKSDDNATKSAILLKLFDISTTISKLGIQVGISFPSISTEFSLTLKTPGKENTYTGNHIICLLELLGVLVEENHTPSVSSVFYTVNGEINGLSFPIEDIKDLDPFMKSIFDHRFPENSNLFICSSQTEFLAKIKETGHIMKFIIPIQTISTSYRQMTAYHTTEKYLAAKKSGIERHWIFPMLDIESSMSGPLIIVIIDEEIKAVCNDEMDIAILLHILSNQEDIPEDGVDFGPLAYNKLPESNLHIAETNFAFEVASILLQSRPEPLLDLAAFPTTANQDLASVLQITRAACSHKNSELFRTVANNAMKDYESELEAVLHKVGFINGSFPATTFEGADWPTISEAIEAFSNSRTVVVTQIRGTYEELKNLSSDMDDDEMEAQLDAIVAILVRIASGESKIYEGNEEEALKVLAKAIQEVVEDEKQFDRRKRITRALEVFFQSVSGSRDYFNILQLDYLCKEMTTFGTLQHCLVPVILEHLNQLEIEEESYPDAQKMVSESISESKLHKMLGILHQIDSNPVLYILHQGFNNLQTLPDPVSVQRLLDNLVVHSYTDEQMKILFSNPKFLFVLKTVLDNAGVASAIEKLQKGIEVKATLQSVSTHKMKKAFIPAIITENVKHSSLLADYKMVQEWSDVTTFISALQVVTARNVMHKNFMHYFHHSLEKYPTLNETLIEKQALFHFEELRNVFKFPWTILTTQRCLSILVPGNVSTKNNAIIPQSELIASTAQKTNKDFGKNPTSFQIKEQLSQSISCPFSHTIGYPNTFPNGWNTPKLNSIIQLLPSHLIINLIRLLSLKSSSRTELLSILLSAIKDYPLFLNHVLLSLAELSIAIPLIIPDISEENTGKYVSFIEALRRTIITNHRHRLELPIYNFQIPHRFILAMSVGDTGLLPGKFWMINNYLLDEKEVFQPISSSQSTEYLDFAQLTEQNCDSTFWNEVANFGENIYLGNLHGDASKDLDWISSVLRMTSKILVFWKVENWNELKTKRQLLVEKLSNPALTSKLMDIVLYPNSSFAEFISEENLLFEEDLENSVNQGKLQAIMRNALQASSGEDINSRKLTSTSAALPIGSPESKEFLNFVREQSILKVKEDISSPETWISQQIAELFMKVLCQDENNLLHSLHHIKNELSIKSCQYGKEFSAKMTSITNQIEASFLNGTPPSKWLQEMRKELQSCSMQFNHRVLRMNDIFLATFQWMTTKGEQDNFMNKYANCIATGFPAQLSQNVYSLTEGPFHPLAIQTLKMIPENARIFIVSVIGLQKTGKTSLLSKLFGPACFDLLPTSGISMTFHQVPHDLKSKLQCDFLLVLDTSGITSSSHTVEKELTKMQRKLVSNILSMSDISLVNILGMDYQQLFNILEVAILSSAKNLSHANIILVHQEMQGNINPENGRIVKDFKFLLNKAKEFVSDYAVQLGMKSSNLDYLVDTYTRTALEEVYYRIAPKEEQETHFQDILQLRKIIHNQCIEGIASRKSLSNWINLVEELNQQFNCPTNPDIFEYEHLAVLEASLVMKSKLRQIKSSTDVALKHHKTYLEKEFILQMNTIFEQGYDKDFHTKLESLLRLCEEHLISIVDNCNGIIMAGNRVAQTRSKPLSINPHSCEDCIEAFTLKESLLSKIRKVGTTCPEEQELVAYLTQARTAVYNEVVQIVLATQIKTQKSILLAEVVSDLVHTDRITTPFSKFLSWLSSRQSVASHEELIKQEVNHVHESLRKDIFHCLSTEDWNDIPFNYDILLNHDAVMDVVPGVRNPVRKLDENEAAWIWIKLENSINEVFMLFEGTYGTARTLHNTGMLQMLSQMLDENILSEFDGNLLPSFASHVHIMGVLVMTTKLDATRQTWNDYMSPVELLQQKKIRFEQNPERFFLPYVSNIQI